MKFCLILLASCSLALAADSTLSEQTLPDVKATIQLPDGWTISTESDDGVFVYHLGKGGADSSITLSVTTKVPDRTGQSPSEYASALIDMSQDEGPNPPVLKGTLNSLPSLRSEYDFDGDNGKMQAVNVAVPNDKTGTLYFFAWQSAIDEPASAGAIREKVLASVKFDPSF